MVEVLRAGYQIPFVSRPPLSETPIPFDSYSPTSIKGKALESELLALVEKGAVELAPPTPGYYSRMFVVSKASGGWRPIIDLSALNHHVQKTKFRMETVQSVLSSVRRNDWMVSLDLKDAYLQVPIHPDSRKYLRFSTNRGTFQFRVPCFGLTTAPQVFTRVMAPVSAILHRLGIRLLRYLDDWLIQASSREACVWARDQVLSLCEELGIRINYQKSQLDPTQSAIYLGIVLDSPTLRASPTPLRTLRFRQLVSEFLSSESQPASIWRRLLGHLSSLTQLVPGGRLRMRGLQIVLRQKWDFVNEEILIQWTDLCRSDLLWWIEDGRLESGISLEAVLPDLMLWSDASDTGWGAYLGTEVASGLWTEVESSRSINWRELEAVRLALLAFQQQIVGESIAIFIDNSTAISYLRRQGGTLAPALNEVAQLILRWAEANQVHLVPQFILGKQNVVADSLSRANQVIGSEWTLHQDVFDQLRKKWPVMIDLFATPLNFRCPIYFAPFTDPQSAGTDALLQPWENLQAYAFPPFCLVRQVLNKVRMLENLDLTLVAPYWPQKEWFPDLLGLAVEPPIRLPVRSDLLKQPHFHRYCLNLQTLSLHAWRLRGGTRCLKASLLV